MNAAAAELGTTWPSLRKAFQRQGLGIPARNPEVVRQQRGERRQADRADRADRPHHQERGMVADAR